MPTRLLYAITNMYGKTQYVNPRQITQISRGSLTDEKHAKGEVWRVYMTDGQYVACEYDSLKGLLAEGQSDV